MANKETNLESPCPIARTAALVGDMWILLIIRDLVEGPKRFNELVASLHSISSRTLTKKLQFLEEQYIIQRCAYNESPPRVEYILTNKGKDLKPVVDSLFEYGERYIN